MKSELKDELKNFFHEFTVSEGTDDYFLRWAHSLQDKLNKKRGRVKGSKYPRVGKTAQALGTKTFAEGFVDSPMFGRQLDVSMLTK